MTVQLPKKLIDTGVEGVEGTGDTLYEGGTSLNRDLNSVYNVFGDYRMYRTDSAQGDLIQTLHARGYPQKHTRAYYAGGEIPSGNPVEFGSYHDISVTRDGNADLILNLPVGYGHQGEYVEIVNTDGTVGYGAGKEFYVRTSGSGDSIAGSGVSLKIQKPYFKLVMWVREAAPTGSVWDYRLENLFGADEIPYSASMVAIPPSNSRRVTLFQKSLYNTVKHIVFVTQQGTNINQECSEVLLLVNNSNNTDNRVYHTEYARLRTDAPGDLAADLLYDFDYRIENGNVIMEINNRSSVAIDVQVKAIGSIGGLTK